MHRILKRLELIKTAIMLEDEELITLQSEKLSDLEVDAAVSGVLALVAGCNYGEAVREIDAYFSKYSGLMLYEDGELQGLRLELKALESRVQALTERRDEWLFTIHEFNTRYTAALGGLIQKILRVKADRLYEQIEEESSDVDAREADYEKAEKEFQEFCEEAEEIRSEVLRELSEEDMAALKKAYREASRLCHPDLVPDEIKEQAHEMMQRLNDAYKKRDLAQVKKLLAALKSGNGFELASDTITDKAMLKSRIAAMRNKVESLKHEVDGLQADETFELIQDLNDWDEYFENIRQQLIEEYDTLASGEVALLE